MSFDMCKEMLGKTFDSVAHINDDNGNGDQLVFTSTDGTKYVFYHSQDCCESVWVEDIAGDLHDLEGSPLLMSETVDGEIPVDEYGHDSITWTFYKFSTIKGYVTVRWCGTSNGYYSENVDEQIILPDGAIKNWYNS